MSERVEEVFFVGSKSLYGDLMSHEAYLSLRDEEYENLDKIRPVNLDHIGASSNPEGEGALQWGVPVKTEFMPKVAITKGRIQGCHIWRDKYLVEGPYCSGIFKRACEQAGVSGIGFGVGVNEVV